MTTKITNYILADNSVNTANVVDASITSTKLAPNAAISNLAAGSIGVTLLADGSVTPAKLSQPLTQATSQATTSGTTKDFTGIPSWVKRITVILNGVSTNGTSPFIIQLGTGAGPTFVTTGYVGIGVHFGAAATASTAYTTGLPLTDQVTATYAYGGLATICLLGSNIWSMSSTIASGTTTTNGSGFGAGTISLGAQLTAVRFTTSGGDTFDAGSINILYE